MKPRITPRKEFPYIDPKLLEATKVAFHREFYNSNTNVNEIYFKEGQQSVICFLESISKEQQERAIKDGGQ